MLKDLKEKFYKNLIIILIAIIFIGIIATICIFRFSRDCNQAGTIGDTISGVFTALAFICAMFAVALQSKELSLQREELKQTREELEGQKKEFQIQNKTLKRQQFENTFFNMLKTQENIIDNLECGLEGTITYKAGRRCFDYLYERLEDRDKYWNSNIEKAQKRYWEYDEMKMLDHYFRHMYRIVKFVHETELLDVEIKEETENFKRKIFEEKYKYIAILRATLSRKELALLFYNGLNNKFKPLIEEYKILQNIRSQFLNKEIFKFYNKSAYGNRYEEIKEELEKLV